MWLHIIFLQGAQLGPGDQRRRDGGVQQARRRAPHLRGQGLAPGQRVRQVPQHRHRSGRRQRSARPLVRRLVSTPDRVLIKFLVQ